jgi:hypothetical protein
MLAATAPFAAAKFPTIPCSRFPPADHPLPNLESSVMNRFLLPVVCLMSLSAANADDSVVKPFNGVDLGGWKMKHPDKSKWVVGRCSMNEKDNAKLNVTEIPSQADGGPGVRELINPSTGSDIYTVEKFGDCTIELEIMVPKGSNSGIYVMGEYEVQILDSYGKEKVTPGDLGGLYSAAAPRVNAAKKPGEWQKFVIEFQAPKFEDGKKTANAKFVKVTLNDQVIHENVEVKAPTPSCLTGKEAATGPIMFQGDHGPVAFRNIVVKKR